LWLAQRWRANCDIQVILCDTDPNNPDPTEIAVVTDYMVTYSTKGNESLVQERKDIQAQILQAREISSSTSDIIRIARQILNQCIFRKMNSRRRSNGSIIRSTFNHMY
jgi:hypothetical protein